MRTDYIKWIPRHKPRNLGKSFQGRGVGKNLDGVDELNVGKDATMNTSNRVQNFGDTQLRLPVSEYVEWATGVTVYDHAKNGTLAAGAIRSTKPTTCRKHAEKSLNAKQLTAEDIDEVAMGQSGKTTQITLSKHNSRDILVGGLHTITDTPSADTRQNFLKTSMNARQVGVCIETWARLRTTIRGYSGHTVDTEHAHGHVQLWDEYTDACARLAGSATQKYCYTQVIGPRQDTSLATHVYRSLDGVRTHHWQRLHVGHVHLDDTYRRLIRTGTRRSLDQLRVPGTHVQAIGRRQDTLTVHAHRPSGRLGGPIRIPASWGEYQEYGIKALSMVQTNGLARTPIHSSGYIRRANGKFKLQGDYKDTFCVRLFDALVVIAPVLKPLSYKRYFFLLRTYYAVSLPDKGRCRKAAHPPTYHLPWVSKAQKKLD
ncbi:hypothetical protein HYPSUDRAFT_53526 [Hypholoma sublateritium FD-334 SS-4]|uniref:Uncharacterized protein n=1 Tax=Hypholoma sublateritium (strain FD-334 SS-4) TaxID=945553 RepID=A0A0D2PZG1_HYPSF|nr:hypothetical protein HYPSUDRAFT_53526 [Hypholoma sublateritium FD-334 SS-4]